MLTLNGEGEDGSPVLSLDIAVSDGQPVNQLLADFADDAIGNLPQRMRPVVR